MHGHQDDDSSRRLFVRREKEALGCVAAALDVVVSQHRNPGRDDQQPDKQRHEHRLSLGHAVEAVVRMDHLEINSTDDTGSETFD